MGVGLSSRARLFSVGRNEDGAGGLALALSGSFLLAGDLFWPVLACSMCLVAGLLALVVLFQKCCSLPLAVLAMRFALASFSDMSGVKSAFRAACCSVSDDFLPYKLRELLGRCAIS